MEFNISEEKINKIKQKLFSDNDVLLRIRKAFLMKWNMDDKKGPSMQRTALCPEFNMAILFILPWSFRGAIAQFARRSQLRWIVNTWTQFQAPKSLDP